MGWGARGGVATAGCWGLCVEGCLCGGHVEEGCRGHSPEGCRGGCSVGGCPWGARCEGGVLGAPGLRGVCEGWAGPVG